VFLNKTIIKELPQDVANVITTSFGNAIHAMDSGKRSKIVELDRPITINGKTFKAIKLKGVVFEAGKKLKNYKYGAKHPGRPKFKYFIKEDGTCIEVPSQDMPTGTMFLEDAKNEFEITRKAYDKGLSINLPIGFGEFIGVNFKDRKVGFVMLGIEDSSDLRLYNSFTDILKHDYMPYREGKAVDYSKLGALLKRFGRELRVFNDSGFIQRYPNLDNMSRAWIFQDLDDSVAADTLTEAQMIGYRILDLTSAITFLRRYIKAFNELPGAYLPESIIDYILEGYFYDEWVVNDQKPSKDDIYEIGNQIFKQHTKIQDTDTNLTRWIKRAAELTLQNRNNAHLSTSDDNPVASGTSAAPQEVALTSIDFDRERNIAIDFRDTIVDRAEKAQKNGQYIILGLDESWILNMSGPQAVVTELERLPENLRQRGLNNVIFVRGKGNDVAIEIQRKQQETKTNFSNIIILGNQSILKSDEFNKLKGNKPENSALLIGINTKHLTYTSGTRLIEMYLLAMRLNLGKQPSELDTKFIKISLSPNGRMRAFIFTPIEPYDIEQFRKINNIQIKQIDNKA